MTNEVKKPPREWWIELANMAAWDIAEKPAAHRPCVRVREILPGDDSIRVSRSDLNQLIETLISKSDSGYEGRIRQSFKDSYQHWLKHIERENPPKQDEGK